VVINRPNLKKDIKIGVKDEKKMCIAPSNTSLHDGTVLSNRISLRTQRYGRVGGMGTREERLKP
jgi:hypothetical protein